MSKLIAMLFSSTAFITILVKILIDSIKAGMTDPIYLLQMSLFGALVFGVIGFYIGRVFEEGKEAIEDGKVILKEKDKELLLDDVLVYDIGVPTTKEEELEEEEINEKP